MITKEDVLFVRTKIAPYETPILSLYADTNPTRPENARQAWAIRAKNTLREMDLPERVRERVLSLLEEQPIPRGRTLALFASEDLLRRYDLHCELPVVDLAHGRVEARWGEPYVIPLLYAMEEYERAGVLWLEGQGWRFFELFLGEIEEVQEVFAAVDPEDWRRLAQYDPARGAALARSHEYPVRDRYARRLEFWAYRFYKRLAHLVERAVVEREIQRLVLLGHREATKSFEHCLSRSMRARVIAHASELPAPGASPALVLEKAAPVLEAAERAQEMRLLDEIESQPGIWGLDPTLQAWQEGRLSVVAAPWGLDFTVWRCPNGWVAGSREAARAVSPEADPEEVALRDLIADLAAAFAVRLEFVRGEAEARLRSKSGGLAGLLRW